MYTILSNMHEWCHVWMRPSVTRCCTLQHTATRCNTQSCQICMSDVMYHLWHDSARCSTLQHTATHCNTLQHTVTHCNTHPCQICMSDVMYEWVICDMTLHTATHCNALQRTATHCNTLQHTATHCNTRVSSDVNSVDTLHSKSSSQLTFENFQDLQYEQLWCPSHTIRCNQLTHQRLISWGAGSWVGLRRMLQLLSCRANRTNPRCVALLVHLWYVLQCVAVCCGVLQCVAVCCSVLQRVAVWCSVLQCVAVCCSVMQCVAVCCSVTWLMQMWYDSFICTRNTLHNKNVAHQKCCTTKMLLFVRYAACAAPILGVLLYSCICDMTHAYVGWLIYIFNVCDSSHHVRMSHVTYAWVTWRINESCHVWQSRHIWILSCEGTWHDSSIVSWMSHVIWTYVTWLIHMWNNAFICSTYVTGFIHPYVAVCLFPFIHMLPLALWMNPII